MNHSIQNDAVKSLDDPRISSDRWLACVNACEGVPTEQLEREGLRRTKLAALRAERDALRADNATLAAQNAELVALVREAANDIAEMGCTCVDRSQGHQRDCVGNRKADALLSRLGGGK